MTVLVISSITFNIIFMQDSATKRSSGLTQRGLQPNPELERLLMQKQYNQQRLIKELEFKEESFQLFQNEHNLKLEQYIQQVNEDTLKLKRRFELEIDNLKTTIVRLEGDVRESMARQNDCQEQMAGLTLSLEEMTKQLLKAENTIRDKQKELTKLVEAHQELSRRFTDSQNRNRDMQEQILILLQVQKNQGTEIAALRQSEAQQRRKIEELAKALTQIQTHLQMFCENLKSREAECSELKYIVSKMDADILAKEDTIQKLTVELEQAVRRQKIRDQEVKHLIKENERLYNEVNATRHRLHDLAVAYNISV